ncbi:MAG TPA: hypothetical protein DEP20_01620 [Fusobacteria bacterium]|nr:hypothetical protein [Fusobacteriota bacterium]|tara:strand:+ start:841 stop:2463 length:1623 start_codon:yes stop_codon:yes gene_type:complete
MIYLFILLSCSNIAKEPVNDSRIAAPSRSIEVDRDTTINYPKNEISDWTRLKKEGSSKDFIKFFDKEAEKGRINSEVFYHFDRDRSAKVNYPFLLLLDFPVDRDTNIRDDAFDYLVNNFMNRSKAGKNFIDASSEMAGGYLVCLAAKMLRFSSFENFVRQTGVDVNVGTERVTPIIAAIYLGDNEKLDFLLRERKASIRSSQGPLAVAFAFWRNNVGALKIIMDNCDRDYVDSLIEGKIPPSAYATPNFNEDIIKFAIANDMRYIDKKDVRKAWLSRMACYVTLAVSNVVLDLSRGMTFNVASIFGKAFEEVLKSFLIYDFTAQKIRAAYKVVSFVFEKGDWVECIKENDEKRGEKLLFAVSNYLQRNKKRKEVKKELGELKELKKKLSFKSYDIREWDDDRVRYLKLIKRMDPDNFAKADRVQTLDRRSTIINFASYGRGNEEVKLIYTSVETGDRYNLDLFECKCLKQGLRLPTFEELSEMHENKIITQNGRYIIRDTDDETSEYRVAVLHGSSLEEEGDLEDDSEGLSYFCIESTVD